MLIAMSFNMCIIVSNSIFVWNAIPLFNETMAWTMSKPCSCQDKDELEQFNNFIYIYDLISDFYRYK